MKSYLGGKKNLALLMIFGIVFLFFVLISHWTPVSGDDWVYAVGGMWNNPFTQAFKMYQTWSGRYLSELWGFLVAPHKTLWNILNPLFFTLILFLLVKNSDSRNPILTVLFGFALMLLVGNKVRMQTYTWIMGTTYVIPLLLFLVQLFLLKRYVFEDKHETWAVIVLCVMNFCIPLYMENAAALICGAGLLVLIYLFFTDKKKLKPMILWFVFAIAGTLIILLSPGAASRLVNDNAEFNALSLGEKIARNWPLFLEHTFLENTGISYALLIVSSIWSHLSRKQDWIWLLVPVCAVLAGITGNGWLYLLFTAVLMFFVIRQENDSNKKWYVVYLILCALGANGVMCVSPIFDSRSGLYTAYLLILAVLVLFNDIELKQNALKWILGIAFSAICVIRMYSYYEIYHLVHLINIRRNQQIEYYRVRPDAGDAWLLAYPDESIHSPNVVEWDDTHMYYFKEYYYLSQDLHLVFYYLDDYNAETIFAAAE